MPAVASRHRPPLTLHPPHEGPCRDGCTVRDVEALAGRVLSERLREWRATLPPERHEEAIAFLVATAWELSGLDSRGRRRRTRLAGTFDPARGVSWSKFCYRRLRLRLPDWYRATFRDARNKTPAPELFSLDGPAPSWRNSSHLGGAAGPTLGDSLEADEEGTEEQALARTGLAIEWQGLSAEALRTVQEIAEPLADGEPLELITRRLRISWRTANSRLEELRLELLGLHPDITEVLR